MYIIAGARNNVFSYSHTETKTTYIILGVITDLSYQCLDDTEWAAIGQKHHTVGYMGGIQTADFVCLFHWPVSCSSSKTEGL